MLQTTFSLGAPGAIGGVTPAAITGTTITANTQLVSPSVGDTTTKTLSLGPDGFGIVLANSSTFVRFYLGTTLQLQFGGESVTLLGNGAGSFFSGSAAGAGHGFNGKNAIITCENADLLVFKPDGTERMRIAPALITASVALTGTTITANTKFVAADSALVLSGATSTTTGIGISGGELDFYAGGSRYMYMFGSTIGVAFTMACTALTCNPQGAGATSLIVGGKLFEHHTSTSTTHTDGTEDNLYSNTVPVFQMGADGYSLHQIEHVSLVAHATATRRVRRYFAGTQIFDSGTLTLSGGAELSISTTIIRESSSVARCEVAVITDSTTAALIGAQLAAYTRITGLNLNNATNIVKTTGVAAGTGAASGDIINILEKTLIQNS